MFPTVLSSLLFVVSSTLAGIPQGSKPVPRFEFLRRVRQVETGWGESVTDSYRERAVAAMVRAEQSSFEGDTLGCAKALDEAAGLTQRPQGVPWWNHAWALTLRERLCDRAAVEQPAELWLYYKPENMVSVGFYAEFNDVDDDDYCIEEEFNAFEKSYYRGTLRLERARLGDNTLHASLFNGDFVLSLRTLTVSVVERRDERIAALGTAIEAAREKSPALELATARRLHGVVKSLASGSTEAHELPGARLLEQAEQIVATAAKGERWFGSQRTGELFLALTQGAEACPMRIFVPEGSSGDKPMPLVLALHGAVFDEDTWFDGYGGGTIRSLCSERGWMLVAPRCDGREGAGDLRAIVDALAERWPIDRERVFVVGHSRGGASALNLAAQPGSGIAAVVAFGAEVEASTAEGLKSTPLFLAVGDHDFARQRVEAFHAALAKSGSKSAQFMLCKNSTHWLTPGLALSTAFEWLSRQSPQPDRR